MNVERHADNVPAPSLNRSCSDVGPCPATAAASTKLSQLGRGAQSSGLLSTIAQPRVQLPFIPTGSSERNQLETWFSILSRRGTFPAVRALIHAVSASSRVVGN
jgi:hypothetical protein